MTENSALLKVLEEVKAKLGELEAELKPVSQETPEDKSIFGCDNLTQEEARAMLKAWFDVNNRNRFGREHKGAGWVVRKDRWTLARQAGFKSYEEAGDFLEG